MLNRESAQATREPQAQPAKLPSEEFALTRRQTLFWLDEQLYPDVPYHHIILRLTLSGALDLARFRRAYAEALAAFDQFRLTFKTQGGEPRQRFSAELHDELPLVDLSLAPERLDDWLIERARKRFDFARALFDAALLRLAHDQHVFYFCQHHVISDGASVGLFLEELSQRYRGLTPPPRPSYALYLRSEKSYRDSPRAQRDQAHFEQRLGGGMPPLALYGRTRVSRRFGVDRSRLALGAERSAAFARVVRDARVELLDPAMSRLVALATLVLAFVYRVGGARKLVLALPVPNRSAEHAQLGGLLMEQTFLRVDVDDGETFATLADKVRTELFASLRHARHSLSDRGLSYVTLNLLRLPAPDFGALRAHVELTPLACSPRLEGAGQGDLRDTFGVHVIGFDERAPLTIGFDFHRDTFDAALQERARQHFLALCDALLADLDRTLDAVELCDEAERAQLLALGRGPEPTSPAPDPLEQIAAAASRRPSYPALRSLGKTLSYGELLRAAGKLAARLAQLGIGRGQRVAFCTPRGADEPLSMLAAWIVGAAYVPLDPSHPRERTRLILEDAQPRLVLTHSTLSDRLPSGHALLLLDREREAIEALEPLPFAAPVDPEDIAYVLFTSGSTGRPKGVEIPRRAIANFLRAMAHRPGLEAGDHLLAVTTTTFDIAALELLLPLCVGALLQIADRETVLDPYLLRETLERDGITVLQATPTTFRLLLEAGLGRRPRKLKLLCGGEAISRALADQLLATGAELWNMYGPTETTVWSTHAELRAESAPISIGTPIDATQVYVLSPGGALQPFGVSGELCIGGAGLARGYLGRPELSAERFIQNPHGPAGERVYRTGDLARYLQGGALQCLGRLDHQVKVRGFRIELGEIEACLRQRSELKEVVVHALTVGPSAPTDPPAASDEPRLVAYYVADRDCEDLLRETAQEKLPSYMQPATYVRLAALPLNTNGKIDRAALPSPTTERAQPGPVASYESPAEQRMAALFQEVLGRDNVPRERDFFALGGDSVRAMQLRRRINETFQVELPLSVLFDAPSVRSLVSALRARDVRPSPLFLQLRPGLREAAPLICVMGIALYRDLALALDTDRAVYGVHVPLGLRSGISAPSVQDIARRYTDLILERVPRGPYHLAGLCFGGLVAFEVAHQLLQRGHQLGTLAVFDGLLPRGARYRPLAHAGALLEKPRRIPERLRARGERLVRRLRGADSPVDELDLNLQGSHAARLARRYDAHAKPLPLPFLLFRAREREEAPWYEIDARLGWGELGRPVTVHSVPGSHLSILQAGNVRAVAEVLGRQLADEPARVSRPPLL